MRKNLLQLLLALPFTAPAQSYFYNNWYYDSPLTLEVGASAGAMNSLTDLGGRTGKGRTFLKDLNPQFTHLCGGLYVTALYQYTIGARLELTFGKVSGADSILKNDQSPARYRYQRNLHFQSPVTEISLMAEFHPFSWLAIRRSETPPRLSPYLLAGIGLFAFNPQAELNNNKVSLRSLHTEGQGFREYPRRPSYQLTQVNFPAGIGLRYEASALLNVRLEIVHRTLQTDYLDDVSTTYINPALFYNYLDPSNASLAAQLADLRHDPLNTDDHKASDIRGNPGKNDAYFSINLKLGLIINRQRVK